MSANDNRTHIYWIRRKSDGLFLAHIGKEMGGHLYKGSWGTTGSFWRKQDTIRKHLLEICTYRVYIAEDIINYWQRDKFIRDGAAPQFTVFPCGTKYKTSGVHFQWLDYYEVVATEITVHGENTLEARDFCSFLGDQTNTNRADRFGSN